MTSTFERKECLFCRDDHGLTELYPQSFVDKDLTPQLFSARRETDHIHYRMVRCKTCGLVFSRDILTPDRLAALYEGSDVTFSAYESTLRHDYWKILQPYMPTIAAGSALEIGCSNGFFLEELQKNGFKQVTGYEPSLLAKKKANASVQSSIISDIFRDSSGAPGKPYDLICSFHTLDHVPEPKAFIQSCLQALRPGGLCCMVVHDVDAWQARLLGKRSPIIDIQHIYLYNRRTLRRLFENAGFEVLQVAALANSYPLSYWVHLFPIGAGWKSLLLKIMSGLGLTMFSAPLRMGNIYVIARSPRGEQK